jgi:alpha-tubulin suppressor-like RCC1 family protein
VTYQLMCSVSYDAEATNQFQGDTEVAFVDSTTNTILPNQTNGTLITPFFTGRGLSRRGTIIFQYTPSTNQTVKLRVLFQSNSGTLRAQTFINQLGTTNVSQFLGTLSNSWSNGNTYPSGALVVNNNSIYQANSTILAGTGFNLGTSGTTWNNLSSQRLDITKISIHGWGTGLLVAGGKVFTFNGIQGNTNWARGVFTSTGNEMPGLLGMRELVFPSETGTLVDAGIQSSQGYALFNNGNLWMWGYNEQGQLGVGDLVNRFFPVLSTTNVSKVYTHPAQDSGDSTQGRWFILKTDGTVHGTGYNGQGQLGVGDTNNRNTWTQITGAGTNPKSVWCLGSFNGTTFVQRADNTIWACGYNGFGQLGNSNTNNQNSFVNVTSAWNGGDNTMVIQEMGYGGRYGDTSNNDSVAINMFLDNGTASRIASAGANFWGSLGDTTQINRSAPVTPTGFSGRVSKMVRAGSAAGSCWVLKTDGTLWNWGYNGQGQLDRGDTIEVKPTPAQVETGVLDISLHNHSWYGYSYLVGSPIIRKADGYYRCGYNVHGQLADATTTNRSNIVKMRFPQGVVFKLFGTQGSQTNEMQTFYGIDTENKIWAWGQNTAYAIQNYEVSIMPQPVQITPTAILK